MTEQTEIPIGSKITTRHEYPGLVAPDGRVYGYLPAGITGEVVGHTEDGRAQIVFYDRIHTFDSLDEMIVEPPAAIWTDTPGTWTNLQIARALTDAILSGDDDKPLKYAVFDAERVCRQMRDEMAAEINRLTNAGLE